MTPIAKKTLLIKINQQQPEQDKIEQAAEIIRKGGTVAFPTETVYGLGANALDERAVAKIFKAKGRPSDNPLIVHVAEIGKVYQLADEVSLLARRAMESFWPGPLTVVLPSKEVVSSTVTGGLGTVGVRMPNHPVALALLKAAAVPVAAPSANSSGRPSPTEAAHVLADLNGKIDALVDGGFSEVGVESTVLDMTGDPPVILRPGGVTREELEAVLGHVDIDKGLAPSPEAAPKAPGMKYRHYSPEARLVLLRGVGITGEDLEGSIKHYLTKGYKIALMGSRELIGSYAGRDVIVGDLGSRKNLEEVAANLFRVLRELDAQKPDIILAEEFPETGLGKAIMNRLTKAAVDSDDGRASSSIKV